MSKEKLLLVVAGGFGRMAAEQAILQYDCAFVDDGQPIGASICGIPVVGSVSDLPVLHSTYQMLAVGIGNNEIRAKVYREAKALGFTFPNIVAPSAYVSPFANIGEGCVILQNACIQNGATLGNGVLINSGVEIHCDSFVDDYVLIYSNSVVQTKAHIGRYARIESNITIGANMLVTENASVKYKEGGSV